MSPDDGMDLTCLLIKHHLSLASGGGDLRDRLFHGDVLHGCSHVAEVCVALGKAMLDLKSAQGEGERKQKLVLSKGLLWSTSGEISPIWRAGGSQGCAANALQHS